MKNSDVDTIILTILYLKRDPIRTKQLLKFIREYYEKVLNTKPVHRATIFRRLKKLVDKGYISKYEYGKHVFYKITDKGIDAYLSKEMESIAPIKDAIIEHLKIKCKELKSGEGYFTYFKCSLDEAIINIKIIEGVFFTEQMKSILTSATIFYKRESKPRFSFKEHSLFDEVLNFLNRFKYEKGALSISIRKLSARKEPFLIIIIGDDIFQIEDEIAKKINKIALIREGKESLLYGAIEGIRRMIKRAKGGIIIFTGRSIRNALYNIDNSINKLLKISKLLE